MSDCILIVDDDDAITEALAMLLESPGRTVVICADVESAELTLARYPVTHLLTDLQFSGEFGFEGLHFLTRVREHHGDCRVVLMTGFPTDALCAEALRNGAAAVLAKPFDAQQLEAALGVTSRRSDEPARRIDVRSIDQILRDDSLSAVFQPIVPLDNDANALGYEALARVDGGWAGGGAAELFSYASRCSKLGDLNLGALACGIAAAPQLPEPSALFLNVDPQVFELPAFPARFLAAAAKARIALERVVLEVTERSGFTSGERAGDAFDELRAHGVRFALDDVGSAYSHLPLITRIQPSFIKISNVFGTGSERDETKRRIVRNVLALARDFDCRTILEGIETRDTAAAATDLGIDFGQGYFYGRPAPASHWVREVLGVCA